MITFEALTEILHCVYRGEHSPSLLSHAIDALAAADFLEMLSLRDHIAAFISRSLNENIDVFRVLMVAAQLGLTSLARDACAHIRSRASQEETASANARRRGRHTVDLQRTKIFAYLQEHPDLLVSFLQLV